MQPRTLQTFSDAAVLGCQKLQIRGERKPAFSPLWSETIFFSCILLLMNLRSHDSLFILNKTVSRRWIYFRFEGLKEVKETYLGLLIILKGKETLQVFVPDDLHCRAVAPLLGNPALSHSKKRGTI